MKLITVRAERAPDADDPQNWTVKVTGMNAEEAKEWTATSFGKHWTIRYTMPSEESFPCFLLARRSSESAASTLAQSTAQHIEQSAQFKVTTGNSEVNPGASYIFNLESNCN